MPGWNSAGWAPTWSTSTLAPLKTMLNFTSPSGRLVSLPSTVPWMRNRLVPSCGCLATAWSAL